MDYRQASVIEFEELWNYSNSPTYNYFLKGIKSSNVEFWTVDNNGTLIGELYIFWDAADKDEANGFDRAYLCAFRISNEYQGMGIGSKLMKRVIKRIEEKGYTEVTIGIDNDEYTKLEAMYNHFGFSTKIKMKNIDDHYFNAEGQKVIQNESYNLVMKNLIPLISE